MISTAAVEIARTEGDLHTDDMPLLPDPALASRLTDVLFAGRFDELHRPWTELLRREVFRYRDGLSQEARSELAYERLRIVNRDIESVEDLVTDTSRLVALHEWLGVVDGSLTTLATVHYNLFLGSLLGLDPLGKVDRTPFTTLDQYGTVLITELGYGNNAARLETTATHHPESDTFVLTTPSRDAQKFMPNTGPVGGDKSGLVAARLVARGQDHGVFLFLVPLRDERGPLPGIRIRPLSQTPGSAVDHAITSFDHVRLDRTALLTGDHADLDPDGTFHSAIRNRRQRFLRSIHRVTTGKLCLAAAALSGARATLTIAVRHAHRRHTSAPGSHSHVPVFAHRGHQSRLLAATARAYAATLLMREVVRRRSDPNDPRPTETEVLVPIVKGWATWQARDIVTECRERCGAQGLLSANRIVDLLTPIEGAITAEGDNLVIWTKAAADLLTGRGYEPPRPPPAGPVDPADPEAVLDLLVHHELTCLARAGDRLAEPADDPLERWNHAVDPALELVEAHVTRRAAESFLAASRRPADPATRALLAQTLHLFALEILTPHTGPLLADGHLTADAVRALPRTVERLRTRLAPHALTLVEAFAVPDTILEAPIATDRYARTYDDPHGPWQSKPSE
ncbi:MULTISPECIES: acyl-CoA dehydrogenase [Streptomyces]|uniref:Acyl-CoA dehydrogenase n=1 Tax=Streptomyces doudnae TaxID=3075536 RepID=A0ABD5F1S4_9ACTN|nr:MULTISPECIES: acyl-CoA dehydrogenase [unclassified Streptomyces]MDT0440475.1 acyl-CoA dehydrogenase [Streptomyces sp. DSM 41981]SCE26297.1 Acyl-coenzyme A oxidase [Streptomyces sp. SolWspMP-5a-2]